VHSIRCIRTHRDYLVNAISRRYCKVLSGVLLSSVAFDDINNSASTDSIWVWTTEEEHAKREHMHDITAMDIYDIKIERCEFNHSALVLGF
jgi:hypothetical protein